MKKSVSFVAIAVATALLWCVGCVEADYQDPIDGQIDTSIGNEGEDLNARFSTANNLSNSLLKQIHLAGSLQNSNSIQYPFCIYTINVSQNTQTENNVQSWATTAMNTWIAPLVGQEGWTVTQAQAYRVQRSGSSCPTSHNGLRVYSIEISDMQGANNSFPGFTMHMGGWGIEKVVVLHEMGHAIGLGDGYTYDSGDHTPIGQPTSTMKDQWNLNGVLQQDDIDGVRFLWARIRGASEPCPAGYTIGGCTGSRCSGAVYCVPTGTTTGTARIEMSKATYAINETFVVRTFNLPGNSSDWVGIYAVGAADNAELQYVYSNGVQNGTMNFTGRAAGSYEARLFFNDSYTREAKVTFKVGAAVVDTCPSDPNKTEPGICGCGVADTDSDKDGTANCKDGCPSDPAKISAGVCGCGVPEGTCTAVPSISMSKSTFAVGETIKVSFSGLSGGGKDWIGLYKTGSSNSSYLVYRYTGSGKVSGTLSFAGRSAGSYEARLFLNDSYTLKKKVSFIVR